MKQEVKTYIENVNSNFCHRSTNPTDLGRAIWNTTQNQVYYVVQDQAGEIVRITVEDFIENPIFQGSIKSSLGVWAFVPNRPRWQEN